MRILGVFFHPASNFSAVGGAEKRFIEILKVWNRRRVHVTVVEPAPKLTPTNCTYCEAFEISNPVSFEGKGLFSIYLTWLLWVVKACLLAPNIVRRQNYDVILSSNNTLPNLILAYMLHILSRTPIVVTVHHFDFPYSDKTANLASAYWMYRKSRFGISVAFIKAVTFFMMLVLVRRSDMCITVSKSTGKFLIRNGVSQERIRVSGNGVDTDLIESFQTGKMQCTGVFVGRIARDKGVFDLVEIWKQMTSGRRDLELCVIGSGPDYERLQQLVEESGMSSQIALKGSCSDAESYGQMKASKIFLFPSMFEGWGLAVGEALACGLPVVCYDIPALHEVFGDCESVFFVPLGNTVRFAEKVREILDRDNSARFESMSKEYVKRFSWKQVAAKDLKIILDLVRQYRSVAKT